MGCFSMDIQQGGLCSVFLSENSALYHLALCTESSSLFNIIFLKSAIVAWFFFFSQWSKYWYRLFGGGWIGHQKEGDKKKVLVPQSCLTL